MIIATIFVYAFLAYLILGLTFAIWFVSKGVNQLDESMREASWKLRLLLLPGSMGLWIVLLIKYLITSRTSQNTNQL